MEKKEHWVVGTGTRKWDYKVIKFEGKKIRVMSNYAGIIVNELKDRIEISLPEVGYGGDVISIYKPRERFGKLIPAEVNWSAIGSVNTSIARRFVDALRLAISFADTLNALDGLSCSDNHQNAATEAEKPHGDKSA